MMPLLVSGEGFEVGTLEFLYWLDFDFGLGGKSRRFTPIVGAMSDFLGHEATRVVSVVGLVSNGNIALKFSGPWKCRPT